MPKNQTTIDCVRHSDDDIRVIFHHEGKVQRYRFSDFKTFYEYFQQMVHCLKISFSKPLNY